MALTEQQRIIRATGIGASEISAIAGLNPYMTALDVYCRKLGLVEDSHSTQTDIGEALEEPIAQLAAKRLGVTLAPGETVRHPEHEWLLATPDRFVIVDGKRVANFEVKNVGFRVAHHWLDEEDGIPDYVRSQVEWQCLATGLPRCYVVALLGGRDLRTYHINSDPEIAKGLVAIGQRFWFKHVIAQVPPEPGRTEADARALGRMFPRDNGSLLPATSEAEKWVAQLREAKASLKVTEEHKTEAENHLKALIGEAAGMTGDDFRITYKTPAGGKVDYEALCGELGITAQQLDKHRRPGARRFVATFKGRE